MINEFIGSNLKCWNMSMSLEGEISFLEYYSKVAFLTQNFNIIVRSYF